MARQTRTTAEQTAVNNDIFTFQLPIDSSLNLGEYTAYGTTDPDIALSMVNVRHMTATRQFRGVWASGGSTDGNLTVPYTAGQVVIGSDDQLYRLNASGTATTDPTTANQTDWTLVGGALNDSFALQGTTGTANPTVRFQQGSHTAQDLQFLAANNMNIVQTGANQVTFDATANPGLSADPSEKSLVAFTAAAQSTGTTVTPNAGSISGTPTVTQSNSGGNGVIGGLAITTGGVITGQVPGGQVPTATYTVTPSVNIQDPQVSSRVYNGATLNIPVTFTDMRVNNEPTVSDNVLVSRIDQSQGAVFNIDTTPNNSTIPLGTAYSVTGFTAQLAGGTTSAVSTASSYTASAVLVDTAVTFRFPFVAQNNQTAPTLNQLDQSRMISVYSPYFITTDVNAIAPTSISGLTPSAAGLPGNDGTEITVTGLAGNTIYIVAPAPVAGTTRTLTLSIGATMTTGVQVGSTISVPNATNTGNVNYNVYQFARLANTSTNFILRNS